MIMESIPWVKTYVTLLLSSTKKKSSKGTASEAELDGCLGEARC